VTYRRNAAKQYVRKPIHGALLRSAVNPSIASARDRAVQSNISGLALFLAKFLSGKGNIVVSTDPYSPGYGVSRMEHEGHPTRYNITVPEWSTYNLPLDDRDKYRIYRDGVWHEAMHTKHTPEGIFKFGVGHDTGGNEILADPLEHDVINIIEDRRIEDLGVKEWHGYVPERLFSNAFAWSRRMDVGEFWKTYLKQDFDEAKGEYTLDTVYIKTRKAHMRHEAFLQRLLVGRIKGGRELPQLERNKIEDEVDLAERLLNKLEKEDETLTDKLGQLTRKVIKDLEMQYYQPKITKFGESSWDQTFKPHPQDDKQETKAGIDDYFDEIMTIEVVCTKCGKHYAKKLGVREDEEHG